MSFRDRLYSASIGGCLIAAVVVTSTSEGNAQSNPSTPAQQTQNQTDPGQSGAPPATQQPQPVLVPEQQQTESAAYQPACDKPKNHDDADLCEQRRMAQAAEDTVWWSRFQTIIGSLGFVAVLFSLFFTGWASIAASRAAKSAAETVRVMRNAERPYFIPRGPELRNFVGEWEQQCRVGIMTVHFDIENIGKGVGFLRTYGVQHEITRQHIPALGRNEPQQIGPYNSLPIRADAIFVTPLSVHGISMAEEDYVSLLKFEKTLHIYGSLRYSDLFGVMRRTGFTFEFIPNSKDAAQSSFVISPSPLWYDTEEQPEREPQKKPARFGFKRKRGPI